MTASLRRVVLGAGVLLCPAPLAGQEPFQLSVVGGPNRTVMLDVQDVDAKFGGEIGLAMGFPVVSVLSFRPEAVVAWKRVGWFNPVPPCLPPGPCPPASVETTSMTWLEVPLLLQLTFRPGTRAGFVQRLYAGPFVALRLSCNVTERPQITNPPTLTTRCPGSQPVPPGQEPPLGYRRTDAGLMVGGSVGVGPIGVGLRWTRSLVATAPEDPFAVGRLNGGKQSALGLVFELALLRP